MEKEPSLDELLFALADRRRRHTISYTRKRDGPVTIAELARTIVEWEDEDGDDETPAEEQVSLVLYHHHLPRLADIDVVRFDEDRNTVEPGEYFSATESLLDDITSEVVLPEG